MSALLEVLAKLRPLSSPWQACSNGFDRVPLPPTVAAQLPADYRALLEMLGPGEGFIGMRLLRLYRPDELGAVNQAYEIQTHLPGHLLFGSDGIGEALLFDLNDPQLRVVEVPFIPLDATYCSATHESFTTFLESLASVPEHLLGQLPIVPNPAMVGLELHEKHPAVLGGEPGPDNQMFLAPPVHAEACRHFNELFRTLRAES